MDTFIGNIFSNSCKVHYPIAQIYTLHIHIYTVYISCSVLMYNIVVNVCTYTHSRYMYQYIYMLCKCNSACEVVKLDFCYACIMTAETLEFESDVTGPTEQPFLV